MDALTPAERRGAIVVVLLLALGAAHDLWRASRPLPTPTQDTRGVAAHQIQGWSGGPGAGDGADSVRDGRDVHSGTPRSGMTSVDLNQATALELDALPGVGPVLAGRIIAHRERHGPFRQAEELLAVRGIGPRLFARLRPRVTVGLATRSGGQPPAAP